MHVGEIAQQWHDLVHDLAEGDVGLRQTRTRHHQADYLVFRQAEALQNLRAVYGLGKTLAHGDAGNLYVAARHAARKQLLHHGFVGGAEQVAPLVGPQALGTVVGGDAHHGERLLGYHARGHGCVGGNDVRGDYRDGLALADEVGIAAEHER